jgi:Protein of unknown function (DUF3606)
MRLCQPFGFWTEKWSVSKEQLVDAVKKAGVSVDAVARELARPIHRLGACLRIGHGAACRLFDRDVGLVGGRVGVGGNGVEGDTRPRFTVRRAAS